MGLGAALAKNLLALAHPVIDAVESQKHNPMDVLSLKLWYLVTILLLLQDYSVFVETKYIKNVSSGVL